MHAETLVPINPLASDTFGRIIRQVRVPSVIRSTSAAGRATAFSVTSDDDEAAAMGRVASEEETVSLRFKTLRLSLDGGMTIVNGGGGSNTIVSSLSLSLTVAASSRAVGKMT